MNDTKDNLIEKLKELIQELLSQCSEVRSTENERNLYKEISALEKQIKEEKPIEDRSAEIIFNDGMDDGEQESKPVYDEAYLNECIAKATPNLSKIKDVDKI